MKYSKKAAIFLGAFLILLALISLSAILLTLRRSQTERALFADIYQDGLLLTSIRLDTVAESYTMEITASDGGSNTVEIRPSSIGIVSADCPDRLCVNQGFIHTSLLPVTCLPHRLVIQIRQEADTDNSTSAASPDMLTY